MESSYFSSVVVLQRPPNRCDSDGLRLHGDYLARRRRRRVIRTVSRPAAASTGRGERNEGAWPSGRLVSAGFGVLGAPAFVLDYRWGMFCVGPWIIALLATLLSLLWTSK